MAPPLSRFIEFASFWPTVLRPIFYLSLTSIFWVSRSVGFSFSWGAFPYKPSLKATFQALYLNKTKLVGNLWLLGKQIRLKAFKRSIFLTFSNYYKVDHFSILSRLLFCSVLHRWRILIFLPYQTPFQTLPTNLSILISSFFSCYVQTHILNL